MDRIAYRWPVFDTADIAAGIEAIVFKQFYQSTADSFSRLNITRQNDKLADVGGGQLLVEPQVLAR